MSVIQKIRDKYARIAVIAIALALLGFILMDAFAGRGSLFGGNDTTLGKINGKKIDYQEFNARVAEISKRQGQNGENATQQVVNGLWQQEITNAVMNEQYKELGITVTDKELDQLLFSMDPSPVVMQAIGTQQAWDPNAFRQRFSRMKTGSVEERAQVKELVDAVVDQAMMDKYQALLNNTVYIPKWFLEKRNVDNSQMAKASYVAVPYTTIADSTVKVTDAEINDYVKAHKRDFELKEEARSISYVQFSANPSAADSAVVRNQLLSLKDSFQSTSNVKEFLAQNRSLAQFNDAWVAKKDLTLQNGDTIFNAPTGTVVGPVVENGLFLMTKIIDRKTQPDTAKVRHILVGTVDPQTGTPTRDTVAAKNRADSIMRAIAGGANFDSLVMKLSDDQGKVVNRGVYDSITRNAQLVQEFKDFALNNPTGTKGVVKTQFGYHYMEVLSQRGSSEVYKLALFALPIEASNETVTEASNAASMFAGNAKDAKSFNEYFEKNLKGKGYNIATAPNLQPMDFNVPGVSGSTRELIRNVFKADKGDVLDPVSIGNSYIVAVVTDVQEPGLPSASAVRTIVEPVLINKKKADKIKQQMGNVGDLNAVAAKFNQQVQTTDSIRFSGNSALGYETKVLGAIFNPSNKNKTVNEGIAGQMGVYATRVENTFTGAVENANIEDQRRMMEMQARQQQRSPVDVLQRKAEIKDYRSKFY